MAIEYEYYENGKYASIWINDMLIGTLLINDPFAPGMECAIKWGVKTDETVPHTWSTFDYLDQATEMVERVEGYLFRKEERNEP